MKITNNFCSIHCLLLSNYGYPDTLTTAGLVLGGFLGVNALGSALGPILAGIFAHDVGFYSMTLTNFGISCLIVINEHQVHMQGYL